MFYENVARLGRASLPTRGAIRLPLGNENTILPLISAEDVSRIAVGLLTSAKLGLGNRISDDREYKFHQGDRRDLRTRLQ